LKTSQHAGFSSFTPKSKYSLSAEEKLKSPTKIASVFANSMSHIAHPVLLFYKPLTQEKQEIKAAFTVSKKNFKRAVDRNKIKRHLREAYRQEKSYLYEGSEPLSYHLVFVYTGKKMSDYHVIAKQMQLLLRKLV